MEKKMTVFVPTLPQFLFVAARSLARYLSVNYISTSRNKIKFGGSGVVGCGGVG